MGLLTCGRCGCSMTAERKKGKYTYYRCTGFHGRCGNAYVREELLADLLGDVVKRIQIPAELADWIADGCATARATSSRLARWRSLSSLSVGAQSRPSWIAGTTTTSRDGSRRDSGRGSLTEWEAELGTIDAESSRMSRPTPAYAATAEKILELAKTAHFRYLEQSFEERRRLLETVLSNCTFDRGSLCPTYVKPFDVRSKAVETGDWRGGRDSNPRPPA